MRVVIAMAHVMVDTARKRKLQNVADGSYAEHGTPGEFLPILLIVPSLHYFVAFLNLLVHNGIGTIVIGSP